MEIKVAYFSAEFGLDPSLPIYSGGLGILAGDHVKAANDLQIPLIGFGIFYRNGYFIQKLEADGTQQAVYPQLKPEDLPLELVRDHDGNELIVNVPIADRTVHLRVWRASVGDIPIYLLDSDHVSNSVWDRHLTDHLYGGDRDMRICQEIILGIGGVRVLRAIGLDPNVWHMNEGHSAFLTLERIREYSARGLSFETALEVVKASTVFTTHTPVPAGHDHFSIELMDRYLGHFYWQLGTSRERVLALGLIDGQFNMTRLAVTTSAKVNGVSKLHAEVTKELFHRWNEKIPAQHIAVDSVTNGVHTRTWLAPELKELFDRYLDPSWEIKVSDRSVWQGVYAISDHELWQAHQQAKRRMIEQLRLPDIEQVLTIGFARRFATYKRALLVFRDLERLQKWVQDSERPVVFVFAGKAHPADVLGQQLIRRIAEISHMDAFHGRVFLLENYDMTMSKLLVAGVDVWLNTPIKPMEASGTSGQKAAINGVLNCSILDGWWVEGYNGKNGWAIEGSRNANTEERDWEDSHTLYRILEEEIIPLYYANRNDESANGVPTSWVQRMKETIHSLTPVFSTSRMVKEYLDHIYVPTATRAERFTANSFEVARRVAAFKRFIREHWDRVKIESIKLIPMASNVMAVHCRVRLDAIWNGDVKVEQVGSNGQKGIWARELKVVKELERGVYLYAGTFAGTQDEWHGQHVNVRIVPISPDFANDFEMELVTWGDTGW
jgi:starch phosphorylase